MQTRQKRSSHIIALSVITMVLGSLAAPYACSAGGNMNNMGTNSSQPSDPNDLSDIPDDDIMKISTPAEAGNPGVFGVTVGVSSTAPTTVPTSSTKKKPSNPSSSLDPDNYPEDRFAQAS
ncbi:MAG: hypothetical protein K2Z81_17820, partial [Cyanobacteria bacterium]|nr:hypothetical protein [Cyanobacteriota bacterium]